MNKPYIRSLNTNQYKLLVAIYSFRFSTRSLLSIYCGLPNNTSFYSRLQILQKHGYIASHYNKDYKLAGREAEFYITPQGLRALRDAGQLNITDDMIVAVYKDKSVGKSFIMQQTLLMGIYLAIAQAHDNIQIFTIRDTQSLDYFPSPRPSLFLSMKIGDTVSRFFLEYIPADTLSSKLSRRLEYYSQYSDEDAWGSATNTELPRVLFVAETGLMEANVRRRIHSEQYKSDEDIEYYTTTQKALLAMDKSNSLVWTPIDDDEPLSLVDIHE